MTDPSGRLHFYTRRSSSARSYPVTPENAFVEGQLYSDPTKDAQQALWLEERFGALESAIDPIIGKIIGAAEQDKCPQLTDEERALWDIFFVTQMKRVPEFARAAINEDIKRTIIGGIVESMSARYPDRIEEIIQLPADENFWKAANLIAVSGVSSRLRRAMQSRGIAVLKVGAPLGAFVIGSRGAVPLGLERARAILQEASEWWLPIPSYVALGPGTATRAEMLAEVPSPAHLRFLNEASATSEAFASCESRLTESLIS